MAKLFETVYNTLSDIFVGNGLQSGAELPTGSLDSPEILKASSPQEMADVALQSQQQRYLNSQFYHLVGSDKDKKLSYESSRVAQYNDYLQMEQYPTISSALNLLAEEATTVGQDGKVLRVYSSNKRVKEVLENLFYNTLDVNTTLQFWVRNLCKYGDCFVFLLLDPQHGIEGFKQLSAFDMERKEEVINNRIQVQFKHKNLYGNGNSGTSNEYNIWQVAHFRLLGDDRRMPYGMSVLDSVRRTWKMLNMCEDAMMVYRITRAAERRIFKVFVGNAKDSEEVKQIMQAVMKNQKGSRLTDPMTGDFNWRYNVASNDQDIYVPVRSENAGTSIDTLPGACLSLDTEIPLLDGRTLTLTQIIAEHERGEKLWVYSINPKTGQVVPGPITWAGVTRKNTQVLKITLDNGEEIIVTPDHKFPIRTGEIKEAQSLQVGESLFSFIKTHKHVNASENLYEMVYDHQKEKFLYTHCLVANAILKEEIVFDLELADAKTIHHADLNQWNNNPENLVYMNSNEALKQTVQNLHPKLPSYDSQIVSIKYLDDLCDTGTITVDGEELYHNFHNFALASGVFTQNSNLGELADISYLRDNLFVGLGIPKSFLGFSEAGGGDGKALSMLDIRFARKVNRIQQSIIAELNKIAIIHLALLGGDYMEHLNNFTITLSNPSTQAELLKIETIKAKLEAYQMAVTPSERGISPMSESMAAREILGISDEDRIDDLLEQFIEAKVGDEIKSAGQLLKSSKLYDKMIKYENAGFAMSSTNGEGGDAPDMGGGGIPPMGGGPDLGGGGPDLGGGGGPDLGGGPAAGNAPGGPLNEAFNRKKGLKKNSVKNGLFEANVIMSQELEKLANSLPAK